MTGFNHFGVYDLDYPALPRLCTTLLLLIVMKRMGGKENQIFDYNKQYTVLGNCFSVLYFVDGKCQNK